MTGAEATGHAAGIGGERILVAYESHHGSTAEIADHVATTLANGGARVDVRYTADIADIIRYDRVVVGGTVRSIAPEIEPVSVKGFAGVLDYSRMGPVTRIFAWFLLRLRGAEAGDHRQWTEITEWARSLETAAATE